MALANTLCCIVKLKEKTQIAENDTFIFVNIDLAQKKTLFFFKLGLNDISFV